MKDWIIGFFLIGGIFLLARVVSNAYFPSSKKVAALEKQLDRNKTGSLVFLGFTNKWGDKDDRDDVVTFLTTLADHKYAVVERDEVYLKRIFGELKFNLSEFVDKTTAKKFGRILGVDAVVIGEWRYGGGTPFTGRDLYLRFINTETGRIIWAGMLRGILL